MEKNQYHQINRIDGAKVQYPSLSVSFSCSNSIEKINKFDSIIRGNYSL